MSAWVVDHGIFFSLYYAYLAHFGTETEVGYEVSGCGAVWPVVGAWFLWFPLAEALFGQSFGKWSFGLRVIAVDGARITFGSAVIRRLLDPIDFTLFGFVAFLVARNTPLQQRVGDLVAKARVVNAD